MTSTTSTPCSPNSKTERFCNNAHWETRARCLKDLGHPDRQHYGYSHYPGQLVSWSARVDKIGRRIGYNWWREFIWTEWRCAYDAWYMAMHEETLLYESEAREYRHNHPSPKFKDFLIQHAGQHTRKD